MNAKYTSVVIQVSEQNLIRGVVIRAPSYLEYIIQETFSTKANSSLRRMSVFFPGQVKMERLLLKFKLSLKNVLNT